MQSIEMAFTKRRKVTFFCVVMVLLLVAGCAFAILRLHLRSKLDSRIEAIRTAGYPVTCAELDEWYSIPEDAQNAAYTIEEAFSFYKKWDEKRSKSLPLLSGEEPTPRTKSLSAEMRTQMAAYIVDNSKALELLHAGAAIESSRYPITLSAGLATLLPHLADIREATQLLRIEGILHAENGDGQSAMRSAISGFGIARSLAREPVVASQLVRARCQALAISTVEQIVSRTELTDGQLAELAECVRDSERICGMFRAFVGERCVGLSLLDNPHSPGSRILPGLPFSPLLELYGTVGLTGADTAIYLELMDAYIKGAGLALHERQEAVEAIDVELKSIPRTRILVRKIAPPLSKATKVDMSTIAHLRTARIAIAMQRYRLAADRLPDKLTDLVPEYLDSVPEDPFDGSEMRYKKLDPGFVIYSIGEDLSDDDGKERPSKTTKGGKPVKWDVTFIVER